MSSQPIPVMVTVNDSRNSLGDNAITALDLALGLESRTGLSFNAMKSGNHTTYDIVKKIIASNADEFSLNSTGVIGLINSIENNVVEFVKTIKDSLPNPVLAEELLNALSKVKEEYKTNSNVAAKESEIKN